MFRVGVLTVYKEIYQHFIITVGKEEKCRYGIIYNNAMFGIVLVSSFSEDGQFSNNRQERHIPANIQLSILHINIIVKNVIVNRAQHITGITNQIPIAGN